MEPSPLTLAHSHARSALRETRKSNVLAASEEHELAAAEFSSAAKETKDSEAVRTLHLLEQYHQQLAEILKFQPSHPPVSPPSDIQEVIEHPPPVPLPQPAETTPQHAQTPTQPRSTTSHPSILPAHRTPGRDLTSSIASNLASARGIPSSQQRRGAPKSPTAPARHGSGKMLSSPAKAVGADTQESRAYAKGSFSSSKAKEPERKSPSTKEHASPESDRRPTESPAAASDEGFQRFYNTFERLISRLSAPLAFGGLPLISEDPSEPSTTHTKPDPDPPSAEPNITKLFSKAALRALKDDPGRGIPVSAESFYVVPTAGGTMTYAGILSRADTEGMAVASRRSLDDEFVDAREHPLAHSRRSSLAAAERAAGRQGQGVTPPSKTLEELQLENAALKHVTDTLSRRLHAWESNAQSSSLALQQSLRALRPVSPTPSEAGGSAGVPPVPPLPGLQQQQPQQQPAVSQEQASDIEARVRELEAQLLVSRKDMERMGRENDKLTKVVGRYREKWDQLKAGARTRREAKGSSAAGISERREQGVDDEVAQGQGLAEAVDGGS